MKRLSLLIILLLILGSSACGKAAPTPKPEAVTAPTLKGKSVLMIIASRDFRDEEYQKTRQFLEARGAAIAVASSSLDMAKGMLGAQVKPDLLLKDVAVGDYNAIVFIGGMGAQEYLNNPTAHALARQAVEKGKILAAICLAPATLARAGVLAGKRATAFPSVAQELKAGGATYTGATVERDGLIITAKGPEASEAFAQEIARALEER